MGKQYAQMNQAQDLILKATTIIKMQFCSYYQQSQFLNYSIIKLLYYYVEYQKSGFVQLSIL